MNFPEKIWIYLERDCDSNSEIKATTNPREFAHPGGELLGEYVFNRQVKSTLVVTETFSLEDAE